MSESSRRCPTCGRSFGEEVLFCPTDGAPLLRGSIAGGDEAEDPYVGLVVLGHITIEKLAGAGSMARVYRAFQRGVDRHVAVKVLHRELSANTEIVERFHREAKVASRLAHPNVVQVLLTAALPEGGSRGGELVIVTEFLDGMSLLSALGAAGGALSLPRALHIVLQICAAVGEAHSQGVVHRDLKPENVMLVRRGDDPDFVKVLDFGLARLSTGEASYATRTGAIFGSPRYISPEGAQGLAVGPAADVYAIATILYQCLSARTPFEAESPVAFLLAHANESPPRLSAQERAAYVPGAITDLIDKALSKRPEDRPKDARAFERALLDAARRSGIDPAGLAGGDVASSIVSLSRTRAMGGTGTMTDEGGSAQTSTRTLADDGGAGVRTRTEVGDRSGPAERTGTLAAPLEDLPHQPPPTSGVSATLCDEPIAVVSTRTPTRADSSPSQRPPAALELPPEAPLVASIPPQSVPPRALEPPSPSTAPPPDPRSTPAPVEGSVDAAPASPTTSFQEVPANSRPGWVTGLLVAACFAVGAGLAALGASKLGTKVPPISRADAILAEVDEASIRREWETPPQQNVRDLLARGRSEFPQDPRFVEASSRASVDVTMLSVKARQAGETQEALRLARLALELDPKNAIAVGIVRELEQPTTPLPPTASQPPSGRVGPRGGQPPPPGVPPVPPAPPGGTARPAPSSDGPDGKRWL